MNDIHPAPKLSVYEAALLQENFRLRGYLKDIATSLNPEWKDLAYPLVSKWMVEEIEKTKQQIETLIDVAARK